MDIDDDSDEEEDDSQDGGDDGTDGGDSRLSKKKKPQRFFCTDFPPCTLSFTRSEHLARHIRYDGRRMKLSS
jgi:C2H2 transcription facotor